MQASTKEFQSIKQQLNSTGFIHLKYGEYLTTDLVLNELGSVIQQTEVRENIKSTRLLASNKSMPFHTDHNAAKYILWFCNSQSAVGGESLLVDANAVFGKMSPNALLQLQTVQVKTHKVFHTDRLTVPFLSYQEGQPSVYYAQWLVENALDSKAAEALKQFEQLIAEVKTTRLALSEGDILIVDNHRMLHGREGFPADSDRWLTRYWLK